MPDTPAAAPEGGTPSSTPATTTPAAAPDPLSEFRDLIPQGADPKAFIKETLGVRKQIDARPGGLDGIVRDKAMELAPALAEEFLRTPEGRRIAAKIAGVRELEAEGEPLSPEQKQLLEVAAKAEAAEARAQKAEEAAAASSTAILESRIWNAMEGEFASAFREQPEAEEFEPQIRRVIALEAKSEPDLLEPGWVKRRALELHGEFSQLQQRVSSKLGTRGRTAGGSGGATAPPKDPTTLTREEAADLMADIMLKGS